MLALVGGIRAEITGTFCIRTSRRTCLNADSPILFVLQPLTTAAVAPPIARVIDEGYFSCRSFLGSLTIPSGSPFEDTDTDPSVGFEDEFRKDHGKVDKGRVSKTLLLPGQGGLQADQTSGRDGTEHQQHLEQDAGNIALSNPPPTKSYAEVAAP